MIGGMANGHLKRPMAGPSSPSDGPGPCTVRQPAGGRSGTRPPAGPISADRRGAVLVEVALCLPILIIMMIGIIAYGAWLGTASAVQQIANEAARAALAGLDATERGTLVDQTVNRSIAGSPLLRPELLSVAKTQDGAFYSVAVSYDVSQSPLFTALPVPLPAGRIRRTSVVKLGML